jgi:magnesium-transporting ATPase (P-type)
MAVSFGIQSWIEGGVIAAVVVLNVVVGFFQEYAAEKTMDSLRSLSSPTGNVTRDGSTIIIPSTDIVPGDMVELKTGDTVPADIRFVDHHRVLYCYRIYTDVGQNKVGGSCQFRDRRSPLNW